jgi:predicted transcriptional regulator
MTLKEVAARLALSVRTAPHSLDAEVTGGYACDLLSHVIARARRGNLWVTIQAHPNIVAVASLVELAGIIVTEDIQLDPVTIERAEEEEIPILTTGSSTFTVVSQLAGLGVVAGVD